MSLKTDFVYYVMEYVFYSSDNFEEWYREDRSNGDTRDSNWGVSDESNKRIK
jgi:hypothetical protein